MSDEPGRALDAEVWALLGKDKGVICQDPFSPMFGDWTGVPFLSTSDAGMGVLIDALAERGYYILLEGWSGRDYYAECSKNGVYWARATTRAHAVALAARKILRNIRTTRENSGERVAFPVVDG